MMKDRKFRKPRMKHGYAVNEVYDALLDLIYGDKGYYLDYSEPDDVIWEIQQYLFGKYQVSTEEIAEIVEELVACGLFSDDHYRAKILTSKRIQEVFYKATVDRKAIDIDFGIWLLTEEKMRELSSKSIILEKFINRPINGVNQPINGENQPINKQSRVEESRVKESRGEAPPTRESLEAQYGKAMVADYIARAGRYRRNGDDVLRAAAAWLEKDTREGRKKRQAAPVVENSSLDMEEYTQWERDYVPVYHKKEHDK